jgi:hypothetical protein
MNGMSNHVYSIRVEPVLAFIWYLGSDCKGAAIEMRPSFKHDKYHVVDHDLSFPKRVEGVNGKVVFADRSKSGRCRVLDLMPPRSRLKGREMN